MGKQIKSITLKLEYIEGSEFFERTFTADELFRKGFTPNKEDWIEASGAFVDSQYYMVRVVKIMSFNY